MLKSWNFSLSVFFFLLKNPAKCLWRWEPDRMSNFFFSPPAHLCAVTYMTEISLIVTLNSQFNLNSTVFFSCILTLFIILIKPLRSKAYDRRASGDCGTSGFKEHSITEKMFFLLLESEYSYTLYFLIMRYFILPLETDLYPNFARLGKCCLILWCLTLGWDNIFALSFSAKNIMTPRRYQ